MLYIVLSFVLVYIVYYHPHVHTNTHKVTDEVQVEPQLLYSPPHFKMNYVIDLKQDGYLIWDQQGNVSKVPFNELEEWFMKDNM